MTRTQSGLLRGVTKGVDDGRKIGGVLEEANGGSASGTGGVTGRDVFERDAPGGGTGDLHGLADLTEAFDALRRTVKGFGRRVKNRAEINVIRAIARGAERGA